MLDKCLQNHFDRFMIFDNNSLLRCNTIHFKLTEELRNFDIGLHVIFSALRFFSTSLLYLYADCKIISRICWRFSTSVSVQLVWSFDRHSHGHSMCFWRFFRDTIIAVTNTESWEEIAEGCLKHYVSELCSAQWNSRKWKML